jgi:hypothetical protein
MFLDADQGSIQWRLPRIQRPATAAPKNQFSSLCSSLSEEYIRPQNSSQYSKQASHSPTPRTPLSRLSRLCSIADDTTSPLSRAASTPDNSHTHGKRNNQGYWELGGLGPSHVGTAQWKTERNAWLRRQDYGGKVRGIARETNAPLMLARGRPIHSAPAQQSRSSNNVRFAVIGDRRSLAVWPEENWATSRGLPEFSQQIEFVAESEVERRILQVLKRTTAADMAKAAALWKDSTPCNTDSII